MGNVRSFELTRAMFTVRSVEGDESNVMRLSQSVDSVSRRIANVTYKTLCSSMHFLQTLQTQFLKPHVPLPFYAEEVVSP